jgi:hypothetical protein
MPLTPLVGITLAGVQPLVGVGVAGLFTSWLIRVAFVDRRA